METVVGIDLGTTFSTVAFVDEKTGRAEVIIDPENQRKVTPSVVMFEDSNNIIVGEIAKQNAVAEPTKVVEFVKEYIGRAKNDPDNGWSFKFEGKSYSAQEISAFIISKLKQDAENRLGTPINKAVITVPAYFTEAKRSATKEAGQIAGLEVLAILDEPMAAAMAYGLDRLGENQTVFVFDLGGGTFDVTIIEIKGNEINELAIDGDPKLGGKDWDNALINHAAAAFQAKYGHDPLEELSSYQDLQLRVIRAKEELSRRPKSRIMVGSRGDSLLVELTREKFEELTNYLVERCRSTCEMVMTEAKKTWQDIDTVLLVGGATRMPMIANMVQQISGKNHFKDLNPDECVVQGAAWQALMLHLQKASAEDEKEWKKKNPALIQKVKEIKVRNITSHDLGVIALDQSRRRRSFLMINKGTPVPCEKVDSTFGVEKAGQSSVRISVTEGGLYMGDDNCDPAECHVLGEVVIQDLPPLPENSPIEVTLRFNENKILEVMGRDVVSGKSASAEIAHPGGLTEEELNEASENLKRTSITS